MKATYTTHLYKVSRTALGVMVPARIQRENNLEKSQNVTVTLEWEQPSRVVDKNEEMNEFLEEIDTMKDKQKEAETYDESSDGDKARICAPSRDYDDAPPGPQQEDPHIAPLY